MYMEMESTAFAFDGKVPNANEVQEAYETATVDIRVKAEVPESFTGTVSIQFTGKKTEGFTVVLEKEKEYTAIISIPRDLYTYKQHTVVDGYDIRVSKNFVLNEAILNDTYLLPVIVSPVSQDSTSRSDEMSYVTAKLYASPQECDFVGEVELSYSGTNGNSFTVTLNQENEYTTEIPLLMDLYTLNDIKISEGYEVKTLYSFNTLDSNNNQKYQMAVKVYAAGESPDLKEEKTFVMKQATFQVLLPEDCPFTGDVTVSYTGNVTYPFELVLKSSEGYMKTVDLPLDTYVLNYAVSYDDIQYTFDAKAQFVLGEADEFVTIPLYIMKEGVVLTNKVNEVKEMSEGIPKQDVEPKKESSYSLLVLLGITVMIVLVVCFGMKILLDKRNGGKQKEIDDMDLDIDLDDNEE